MSRPSSISRPLLGLAFVLLFPSTAVVQRFLGLPGVAVYLAAAFGLLWLGQRVVFPWVIARIPPRWAAGLLVASFLALPVVLGTVMMSTGLGRIDFSFASFGVMFLFFGAAAFWPAEGKASIDEANTTYQASASTWSAVDQGRQEAQHLPERQPQDPGAKTQRDRR